MAPAILPGDWLLVDPAPRRWPRPGSVVVFREPGSGVVVIKRVAARGPSVVQTELGALPLDPGEAWLLGDAPGSHDSRHYGPVRFERAIARAWFRYGPIGRIGPLRRVGPLGPGRQVGRSDGEGQLAEGNRPPDRVG